MNQAQLIDAISAHRNDKGVAKSHIKYVLDSLGEITQAELQKGEGAEVTLPGIGKISVKQSPARIGRNLKTGDKIDIPAKNKPHFSAAKALKDAAMSN